MVETDDTNRTPDTLTKLSVLVAEVVKGLHGQRQPITPDVLQMALSKRPDLCSLLREGGTRLESGECRGESDDPERMKNQLQILGEQKARLLNEVSQLEEELKHLWEFSTGSLLTLVSWVEASSRRDLFRKTIKKFKTQLGQAEDLNALESHFLALKDQILKEDIEPSANAKQGSANKFSIKSWFTGSQRQVDRNDPDGTEDSLAALKELLAAFLDEFDDSLPKSVGKELSELRELISRCRTYADLPTLREHLMQLGHLCGERLHGERDQFVRVIREIDQYLEEMEAHLLDSMGQARAMAQANTAFDEQMARGMTEMSESVAAGQSSERLHRVVVSKLAFLRQALETKRKDDEQRLAQVNEKMENLQKSVAAMREEVSMTREQSRQLTEQLHKDSLTGILNRRGYEDRIAQEFERFQRHGHMLSLVLFDLDDFKRINDEFGHQRGDRCLQVISKQVSPVIRKNDALARYGGDEFVLILPGVGQHEAAIAAEKIRRLVEHFRFLYEGKRLPITLSMGVTQVRDGDETPDDLFRRSDQALYAAKREGRNRVRVYEEDQSTRQNGAGRSTGQVSAGNPQIS